MDVQVLVSHIAASEDAIQVFLQLTDGVVELEQLYDRLDDAFSAGESVALLSYCRGDPVAVQVATIWQRAKVLRDTVAGDTTVVVHCVDIGSEHDVDFDKVRCMRADLMSEPPFAFDCELIGAKADAGIVSVWCSTHSHLKIIGKSPITCNNNTSTALKLNMRILYIL